MQYVTETKLTNADILIVDAGVERLRAFAVTSGGAIVNRWTHPSSDGFSRKRFPEQKELRIPVHITGKLSKLALEYWKKGKYLSALAVKWSATSMLATKHSVGLIELSASGYALLGVKPYRKLHDDLMVTHPRCGAGVWFNIDRVLLKLGWKREQVDSLLFEYLGDAGSKMRGELPIRLDRCGVFASSTTISDKNQGIPLPYALAVTLKSEVIKACCHLKKPIDSVWLTEGVFNWHEYSGESVPPIPGYRACFGLIETMVREKWKHPVCLHWQRFTDKFFEKRIIQCHGVACGDPKARCSRTRLSGTDAAMVNVCTFSLEGAVPLMNGAPLSTEKKSDFREICSVKYGSLLRIVYHPPRIKTAWSSPGALLFRSGVFFLLNCFFHLVS